MELAGRRALVTACRPGRSVKMSIPRPPIRPPSGCPPRAPPGSRRPRCTGTVPSRSSARPTAARCSVSGRGTGACPRPGPPSPTAWGPRSCSRCPSGRRPYWSRPRRVPLSWPNGPGFYAATLFFAGLAAGVPGGMAAYRLLAHEAVVQAAAQGGVHRRRPDHRDRQGPSRRAQGDGRRRARPRRPGRVGFACAGLEPGRAVGRVRLLKGTDLVVGEVQVQGCDSFGQVMRFGRSDGRVRRPLPCGE